MWFIYLGLISVTWVSTNIEECKNLLRKKSSLIYLFNIEYLKKKDLKNVQFELESFENLCIQVKDIIECRVETALNEIAVTSLCNLPNDPCTIEEFTKLADETAQKAIVQLAK